jgi:hypothetical protein
LYSLTAAGGMEIILEWRWREGHVLDPAVEKMIRNVATNVMNYVNHNICPAVTLERILRNGPGSIDFELAAKH